MFVVNFRNVASVVETIAHLEKDFARIEEVRAAKGEAAVEKDAAVGDVESLEAGGEFFTAGFAE